MSKLSQALKLIKNGKYQDAEQLLVDLVELNKNVAEKLPNDHKAKKDLIIAYNIVVSEFYNKAEEHMEKKQYLQAIKLFNLTHDHTKFILELNPAYNVAEERLITITRSLSNCYNDYAEELYIESKEYIFEENYAKAIELLFLVIKYLEISIEIDSKDEISQDNLTNIKSNLSLFYSLYCDQLLEQALDHLKEKNLDNFLELFNRMIEIYSDALNFDPSDQMIKENLEEFTEQIITELEVFKKTIIDSDPEFLNIKPELFQTCITSGTIFMHLATLYSRHKKHVFENFVKITDYATEYFEQASETSDRAYVNTYYNSWLHRTKARVFVGGAKDYLEKQQTHDAIAVANYAIGYYQQALTCNPTSIFDKNELAKTYMFLSQIYHDIGDIEHSQKSIQDAMAIDSDTATKKLIAEYSMKINKPKQAIDENNQTTLTSSSAIDPQNFQTGRINQSSPSISK